MVNARPTAQSLANDFAGDPAHVPTVFERLRALDIADVSIEMLEYVACLADRRDLRLVRAFLDVVPPLADEP